MSMVETITKHQIPTEFSFPLRPDADNLNHPNINTPSRTSNHSRQYTGIQLDLPLPLNTNNDKNDVKPPTSKSSHRKHAHRRSAAISHDFSLEQPNLLSPKPLSFALAPSISLDDHSLKAHDPVSDTNKVINSPYGNYSSSALNSSFHLPSAQFSKSTPSLTSSPEFKSKKVVQFSPDIKEIQKPITFDDNEKKIVSSPLHFSECPIIESNIRPGPKSEKVAPVAKHKKVKSWAGSFIKFRSNKKDGAKVNNNVSTADKKRSSIALENDSLRKSLELSPSTLNSSNSSNSPKNFTSSSYVSTADVSDSATVSFAISLSEPAEPLIDLDAALGPFRTPKSFKDSQFQPSHRRTESAPESMFDQYGGRPRFDRSLMKRRGTSLVVDNEDVIIEEEEDATLSAIGQQQAASTSETSLESKSSSSSVLVSPQTRKKKHFEPTNSLKLVPILANEPIKADGCLSTSASTRSLSKLTVPSKVTISSSTPKADNRNQESPIISTSSVATRSCSIGSISTLNTNIPKSKSSNNVKLTDYNSSSSTLGIPRSKSMILPDNDDELHKENLSEFGEPGPAVRVNHSPNKINQPVTPTTPGRGERKASSSGRHGKRFSISSLASLGIYSPSNSSITTTASTRQRVTRRVLSWVGFRSKQKM